MFKRLFWFSFGASLGMGGSWWVTRTVRQKLERYAPVRLSAGVANTAQSITRGVRAAVADGRDAMHERESELRAQFDARYAHAPNPNPNPIPNPNQNPNNGSR